MKRLQAALRLARAVLHLLSGLWTITTRFGKLDSAARFVHIKAWSRELLRILGIEVQVHGQPPERGPLLLVANHISWLDISVLHSACPCRFVSKADVRDWPLIGPLATGCDTIYVERASRRDAMRVVHRMADTLREGGMVAVFPEGTTSTGEGLLPFHANLIQAAIAAEAPVQPLAVRFTSPDGSHSTAPSYVGDEALWESVWRTVCSAPLVAHVWVGQPRVAEGRDRRVWAHDLQAEVAALRGDALSSV